MTTKNSFQISLEKNLPLQLQGFVSDHPQLYLYPTASAFFATPYVSDRPNAEGGGFMWMSAMKVPEAAVVTGVQYFTTGQVAGGPTGDAAVFNGVSLWKISGTDFELVAHSANDTSFMTQTLPSVQGVQVPFEEPVALTSTDVYYVAISAKLGNDPQSGNGFQALLYQQTESDAFVQQINNQTYSRVLLYSASAPSATLPTTIPIGDFVVGGAWTNYLDFY